uniref:Si:ch211-196h16.12 n=1 Tax=Sinocyclocheilus rhinocerous TaxID=307959 RepID=A0A673GH42_9TELE
MPQMLSIKFNLYRTLRIVQDINKLNYVIKSIYCFLQLSAQQQLSEENLELWLACEEYKSASGSHNIYNLFINPDAPREVRDESTPKALFDPTADTFGEAQQRIFSLVAKDSFPRYLRSSYSQQPLKHKTSLK